MTIVPTASAQRRVIDELTTITAPVGPALRFSFVALEPRTALSTVAALTMRELRRGRAGRILSVDTRLGQSGRAVLLEGSPLSDETFVRIPEGTREWMRERGGLVAVSFDHGGVADWNRVIAPVVRHFDIVGTDWGALAQDDASIAARTGHVVCITGTWERDSAESAIAFARAIHDQTDECRPIVVLSDVTRTRSTWPRLVTRHVPVRVLAVPHDRLLAAGGPASPPTTTRARMVAAALRAAADGRAPSHGELR
ncbi:hypothetical protein QFZ53_002830 [Microbacterium natoriense]|uniref:MinD-like ATPase involved in chromosome partitioning or flagellar assembly n=1 Tax=Microbacterium natoriense TaxID=284570 RepID=A0AAW8F0R2_9MICO|nr:hypothetical protein [Microbacterium natoriense]MDQ0648634.1 hypothetical protein [Microbacterium natoriense]